MIRIIDIAASSPPYVTITSHGSISVYGTSQTYGSLSTASFVVAARGLSPLTEVECEVGTLHSSSDTMGTIRDRGVIHFNAKGTLKHYGLSFVSRVDANGVNQFRTSTGMWLTRGGGLTGWGDEVVYSTTIPSYTVLGSIIKEIDPSYGTWSFVYAGDYALLIAKIMNGETRNSVTKEVLSPATTKWVIDSYRRSGTSIYSMGYETIFDDPTGQEQQLRLSTIPTTGGTLLSSSTVWSTTLNPELTEDNIASFEDAVRQRLYSIPFFKTEVDNELLGELASECSGQLKFVDQNILCSVFDIDSIYNFRELWESVLNSRGWKRAFSAARRIKRGHGKLQDLAKLFKPGASMYLFEKYAVLTSIDDWRRLVDGVGRFSSFLRYQRLHSRRVTPIEAPGYPSAMRTTVLTVQCAEYPTSFTGGMQEAIAELKKWGIYPEVPNLWDMLPYSFCADWVVSFGNVLDESQQFLNQKDYFPVHYCVPSQRDVWSASVSSFAPDFPAEGVVEFSYYHRWISRELPLPAVHLPQVSPTGAFQHWPELTALVLQRL